MAKPVKKGPSLPGFDSDDAPEPTRPFTERFIPPTPRPFAEQIRNAQPGLFGGIPLSEGSVVRDEPLAQPEPTFAERVRPSGEKSKARDILAAIRTLHQVEQRGTRATAEEREVLARFPGFGPVALSIFPNPATGAFKDGWEEVGEELKALLTPEEYASAKATTFNAFYTSPVVIDAMHSALDRLGVPTGATVLEPGCGAARFFKPGKRYIGVEKDRISGRIARALHPEADIRIEDFQDTRLPQLDAVIGNVPFADVKLDHHGQKFSLHDYFFAKSVDSLKPGGVLALVTSHYTLDKQNAAIREYLADRADFLGAIRLPSDAFKKEGTAVVTDIVFLRKRSLDEPPRNAGDWLQAEPTEIDGRTLPISAYFKRHPEMVLGTYSGKDSLYGEGYSVTSNGDLAEQLREAVERLPRHQGLESKEPGIAKLSPPVFVPPPPERHISEGSFFVHEGRIHQLVDGQAEPVVYGGGELWANGAMFGRRMGALIELRDLARRVLQSQNEGWPDEERDRSRLRLNRAYDFFKSAYGPINKTTFSETKDGTTIRRMPNLAKFREDPDAMLVMALEEYDEETGTAKKAPIMSRDVVGQTPPVTSVATAEEGLLVSLNQRGVVDLPYISKLYGKPEDAVVAELGDLIYQNPETRGWEPADQYLSGNVRAKLAAAEKSGIERNVEALKAVIPEDVLPGDIDANLGAPWIPASDIQEFAGHLFGVEPSSITIAHMAKDAVWSLEGDWSAERSVANTADYGTGRASGLTLLDLALNLRTPTIYDPVPGDPDKRQVNQEETLKAKEKQKAIKEQFRSWVFSDHDRTERLVRLYNDTYNNLRPRVFDGSHLDFPGMSRAVQLRQHQLDVIWRGMSGGNTLISHVVGAGKAQPLDSKVLTPTGWSRMGDLRVGDEVIAGDGTVTTVTGVFPQGRKAIWRVAFSDGSSTECCEEHLWLTQTYRERSYEQRGVKLGKIWDCAVPKVRTTSEMRDTLISPHLGAKNHSIPMVGVVRFAERPVPLDPYTLGALIGDGCLRAGGIRFSNLDEEILDHFRLPENVERSLQCVSDRCQDWGFRTIKVTGHGAQRTKNPLTQVIGQLGLLGCKSAEKFVPEVYKVNDAAVRLAVLQGLLDTDGSVEKKGVSTYYYTISPQLADDVTFLVQSLGGLVRRRIKERPTYRHNGELRVGKPCFVLCISLPPELNPFRLSRKANLVRPKSSYVPRRYVVSVEPVGEKAAQCIAVAHPSHLYVTDDFIVTHNTYSAAAIAMKMKQAGLVKKCLLAVPNHLLEQFAREFQHLYPNAKLLIATKDDFTKERRKYLTAKIASGDWDAIIVTHAGFERIGMSKEYQARFLREQIAEYDQLLADRAKENYSKARRNVLKVIEKQKAAREAKLKELLAEDKKDSGLVFDELGVDQVIVDECFTYDTLIDTDRGLLKIGDVVSKRLPVSLRTWNKTTGVVELKPIVNWFTNERKGPLVEVVHESGSFICTPRHKLWIAGFGYKKAGEVVPGEELLVLRGGLHSESRAESGEYAEALLPGLQDEGSNPDEDLRVLPDGVRLHRHQPGHGGQAPQTVLFGQMQDAGTAGEPGERVQVQDGHAAPLGEPVEQGQTEPGSGVPDEVRQPNVLRRDAGSSVAVAERDGAQTVRSWRERTPVGPADAASRENRDGDRVCGGDQRNPAPDPQVREVLQGGLGRSKSATDRRGGREHAQLPVRPSTGREEGVGSVPSRVVRVAILEPGSDGEYRFGGRTHQVVFDIEVADNHNYFANGVLVSNCQAYKNLETPTKMDRVAGIQTGGSERAFDLYMKARYLHNLHPGHGLIGLSGTPISNSLVEMYTMQRFFDPDGLRDRGIDHFDAWAATFGEVVEAMEISPDGKSLRPRARFSKFINLPELQQMFRAFADVQTADMLNLPRPSLEGGKPHVVACPMSDEQHAIQQTLVERYERIRNGGVDPREDNALAITTDGRKLALDARMLDAAAPDFPESKVNAMVDNVLGIWKRTADTKGTQMVFCDFGVNPTPWGYCAYDEIVEKLAGKGIPREQIAVVGDADSDAKKQALFEKVRNGAVRVLIGSTSKMGTGTNVQKRLIAMHHLDAPWKPAEVEQRDGRILRQGNQNAEVAIYRYVTEGSFDAYMWQALETKAKFIAQIMTGESGLRKAEDVGGQELSYAEVKAIASGNPAVLTLAEADAELQRLGVLRRSHTDEQYISRVKLKELPQAIERAGKRLAALEADAATIAGGGDLVVGGKSIGHQDTALATALNRIPDQVDFRRQYPVGTFHGLSFGIDKHPGSAADVYLEGQAYRTAMLSSHGPRAVWNALNRLATSYGEVSEAVRKEREVAERQLADYQERLGKPFRHAAYMDELTVLRDQLKLALSDRPGEPEAEKGPSAADLAEKIKALRGSHQVEAAPVKKLDPRRTAPHEVEAKAEGALPVEQPTPAPEPVADEPTAFRQRVGRGGQQMSLF